MNSALRRSALLLLLATSLHAQQGSQARARATGETSSKAPLGVAHVYKTISGRDLHVYIANPDAASFHGPRPVMISIHGGGFTGGTPSSLNPQAQWALDRGIASAEVEYRLLKNGASSLEDCIMDARSAVRYVRSHAKEFNFDPAHIILMGGSAGGYLTEANILLAGPDDPADDKSISTIPFAVILFNPMLNGAPGSAGAILEGDKWRDLAPLQRVTAAQPPTIILHGASDTTVGVTDIVDFQKKLAALSVRADLFLYPGQVHAFFNKEPYTTATWIQADAFLTSLHLTAGPPLQLTNPLSPDQMPKLFK